jgi:hypothetical protein
MIFNAETLIDRSKRRVPTCAGNVLPIPTGTFSVIIIKYEVLNDLEKLGSGGLGSCCAWPEMEASRMRMRDSGTQEQRYDVFVV